jgi:hypothetical protein
VTERRPRLFDPGYLRWLRKQRCCVCGRTAPNQAAHVRMAAPGGITGMGRKPDDKDAVPLCQWCHLDAPDSQHNTGNEAVFWKRYEIDPVALAAKYYAEYGGTGGRPRTPKGIKLRLPRERRAKIKTGKTTWPKRKFGQ